MHLFLSWRNANHRSLSLYLSLYIYIYMRVCTCFNEWDIYSISSLVQKLFPCTPIHSSPFTHLTTQTPLLDNLLSFFNASSFRSALPPGTINLPSVYTFGEYSSIFPLYASNTLKKTLLHSFQQVLLFPPSFLIRSKTISYPMLPSLSFP